MPKGSTSLKGGIGAKPQGLVGAQLSHRRDRSRGGGVLDGELLLHGCLPGAGRAPGVTQLLYSASRVNTVEPARSSRTADAACVPSSHSAPSMTSRFRPPRCTRLLTIAGAEIANHLPSGNAGNRRLTRPPHVFRRSGSPSSSRRASPAPALAPVPPDSCSRASNSSFSVLMAAPRMRHFN